jgi:hypothetical protein
MRSRDDRAATNQRATDPLYQARRRAVAESQQKLEPRAPAQDRPLPKEARLATAGAWDGLNVSYLRGEWPASMLN